MRARLLCLLAVLAYAAFGFVLRSALQPDPPLARALPPAPTEASPEFAVARGTSRAVPEDGYLIATARGRSVAVFGRPAAGHSGRRVRQREVSGKPVPLVFLVRERRKGWAKVWLPGRPGGRSAWIRRGDVDYEVTRVHLRVRLGAHRLDVFRGRQRVATHPIGVGRAVTPTPRGRTYVTDLIRSKDPKGLYGPYVLGLAAHSPVDTGFGDDQIGIHGTDAPELLGTDVSAGCIRVANSVVRALARLVPLGAPVDIKP